jgi:ERCC4-type nuclease
MLAVILLEGDVYGNSRRMLIQQIDGAISFLTTIQRLSVLSTVSMRHTAYMLAKLATHERSGLGYTPPLRGSTPKTLSSQQSFLLQGLPGVGADLADRMLEHFGSIPAVMHASADELAAVRGIGPGRAQKIHAVLAAPWEPNQ